MPRPKKDATTAPKMQHRRPRTTDPDARIALADKQIQRLEALNENRRELIAKNGRKIEPAQNSIEQVGSHVRKCARPSVSVSSLSKNALLCQKRKKPLIVLKKRAKMAALMDALKKKGISLDDIIQELDKSEP